MCEIHKRSRLPHWDSDAGAYFVTFNLADAMPAEVVQRLENERRVRIAELERLKEHATRAELHAIDQVIRERAEECLDSGIGACWMREVRAGLSDWRWVKVYAGRFESPGETPADCGRDARSPGGIH